MSHHEDDKDIHYDLLLLYTVTGKALACLMSACLVCVSMMQHICAPANQVFEELCQRHNMLLKCTCVNADMQVTPCITNVPQEKIWPDALTAYFWVMTLTGKRKQSLYMATICLPRSDQWTSMNHNATTEPKGNHSACL